MTTISSKPSQPGPRMLKDPNSVDFAIQTWSYVKTCLQSLSVTEERFEQALEEAEQHEIYKRIPPGYNSLDELSRADLGISIAKAKADKQAQVIQLADYYKGDELGNRGGDHKSDAYREGNQSSIRTLIDRGETADYLTARIARDHPDILQEMRDGKYTSVRAAARAAGIVKERISIPVDNARAAAQILQRRLTEEQLDALIEALNEL